MKFLRKETQISVEQAMLSLTLQSEEGNVFVTYPAEVIDSLRRMISRLISKKTMPARLSFIAALRQEGVTFLSRGMALLMANDLEASVCAVELNWWWYDKNISYPSRTNGLAGVLTEHNRIDQTILRTSRPNLFILPAGKMAVVDRPVFARSARLQEILYQLSKKFDYLVLDIPAILATNDAIPLATLGDAACLVVHQGVTPIEKVRSILDEIDHNTILGVVLNKTRNYTPKFLVDLIPQDTILEIETN